MTESEFIQAGNASGRSETNGNLMACGFGGSRRAPKTAPQVQRRTTLLTPGLHLRSRIAKGVAVMKLKEYDFTRNPIRRSSSNLNVFTAVLQFSD